MATRAKSKSVLYRDPSMDEAVKVSVTDGDPGADSVLTVKLPESGVQVQVARVGEHQIGAAYWVADKDELPL